MATKPDKLAIHSKKRRPTESCGTWSGGQVASEKTKVLSQTKLGRMVAFDEGLLSTKSHNPLNMLLRGYLT